MERGYWGLERRTTTLSETLLTLTATWREWNASTVARSILKIFVLGFILEFLFSSTSCLHHDCGLLYATPPEALSVPVDRDSKITGWQLIQQKNTFN